MLPSAPDGGGMPTAAQMKAARALLEWSGDDLAKKAGVSLITVRRAESADADPSTLAYRAIVRAIEDAGIEFIEDRGVALRKAP
jgi:predicted transcriptional regulator